MIQITQAQYDEFTVAVADAARWQWVLAQFHAMKTSEAARFLEALGLDPDDPSMFSASAPVAALTIGEAVGYVEHSREYNFHACPVMTRVIEYPGLAKLPNGTKLYAAPQASEEARKSVMYVIKTFEAAEKMGYHTKDRQFAISILGQALKDWNK